jgi:adenylate kinase family enzyme
VCVCVCVCVRGGGCREAVGGAKREDDTVEVLKRRFENYEAQSRPVIEAYGPTGLVCRINAGRDVEDVYADVAKAIQKSVF